MYTKKEEGQLDICVCSKDFKFDHPWKLEVFVDDPSKKNVDSLLDDIRDLLGINSVWMSEEDSVRSWVLYEKVLDLLSFRNLE